MKKQKLSFLNETQQKELFKGAKVLYWGLLGFLFVLVLKWLGVDLEPLTTALVSLGANAIAFTSWRFFTRKDTTTPPPEDEVDGDLG